MYKNTNRILSKKPQGNASKKAGERQQNLSEEEKKIKSVIVNVIAMKTFPITKSKG